jgi:hypothetical protein
MEPLTHLARLEKKCKKPLDNQHQMCYNKDVLKREEHKNNWVVTYHKKWRLILWLLTR